MLAEAKEICPTTTRHALEAGALLVNVREPSEVSALAFDVPDVVNIPLLELDTRWSELPTDRDLVIACESGARSLKGTYYLQFRGFERVSHLGGGIVKWMKKGFPVKGQRHALVSCPEGACTTDCRPMSKSAGCC
jgi:rhodanese-related sulfurtransferase